MGKGDRSDKKAIYAKLENFLKCMFLVCFFMTHFFPSQANNSPWRQLMPKSRYHYCMFCKSFQPNVWRHLAQKHKSEDLVQEALSYPKASSERKRSMTLMLRKGDHIYNKYAYFNGGKYILMRRPLKSFLVKKEDYGPCLKCFGWFAVKSLWQHTPHCPERLAKYFLN